MLHLSIMQYLLIKLCYQILFLHFLSNSISGSGDFYIVIEFVIFNIFSTNSTYIKLKNSWMKYNIYTYTRTDCNRYRLPFLRSVYIPLFMSKRYTENTDIPLIYLEYRNTDNTEIQIISMLSVYRKYLEDP